MRRERRRATGPISWTEATAAHLLVTDYTIRTRQTYKRHLKRAGQLLGEVPLGRLTPKDLEAYRASVLASREGGKAHALGVTRVFLLWAGEVGLHELEPKTIREALRPPGAIRGVVASGSSTRWRRGQDASVAAPLAAPVETLPAFGYPAGAAGLALVAEEIRALRDALCEAGHERWGKLVRDTEHPVNAQPGGAAAAALDALRDAATGSRSGEALFLAGLGYEGPSGERRLLGALRELRAAFAAQQRETLGETVWRLSWTELPIPIPAGRDAKPS